MIAKKIIPEVPKNISPEKKFSITLHMGYIYDPQKKRFSFLIDHSSKMDLKIRINQLFKISQPIITSPPQIEGREQKEYETAIKTAIQNYLRTAIKEIYTEFQNDADPIKNFFYSGDCNLGYASESIFPNFLTNMPEFFQWLSECFPDGLFTEDTGSIQEVINIKRGLFSGNIDIVDRATTVYEQNFSEELVGQTFESLNIFYEKSKKIEALKTLLALEWPELKKKTIKPAKQAFISELKSEQTSDFSSIDRVRGFDEDDEPAIKNTSINPVNNSSKTIHSRFFNHVYQAIISTFSRPMFSCLTVMTISSAEEIPSQIQSNSFSFFHKKNNHDKLITPETHVGDYKQKKPSFDEGTHFSSHNSLPENYRRHSTSRSHSNAPVIIGLAENSAGYTC